MDTLTLDFLLNEGNQICWKKEILPTYGQIFGYHSGKYISLVNDTKQKNFNLESAS